MARDYQGDAVCKCGRDVPVFKTGGGMLTTSCGWCRLQQHCGAGSSSYRKLVSELKLGLNPDAEPQQVIVKPEVKPATTKTVATIEPPAETEKTIFDIFK